LIGTPVGILAGTYLAEYGKEELARRGDALPQRCAALRAFYRDRLFVYTVYVAHVKHFSGWAGAIALALIVIRSWCVPPTTC